MPALFSLGQHRALEAVQSHLGPTERLFAFLDDIYVVCGPDRVWQIHEDLRTQLWTHAKIQMHKGKTQVWNRGGVAPDGWERSISSEVRPCSSGVEGEHDAPPI